MNLLVAFLVMADRSWWWDAAVPTWALVIVGIFGSIAALKTLAAIQRQTESLIASERAWVLVNVEWVPGFAGAMVGSHVEHGQLQESISVGIRVICKNYGNTPAWITEIRAKLEILAEGKSLPISPCLVSAQPIHAGPEPVPPGGDFRKDETLTGEGTPDLGVTTVIYGVVKYRDMFSQARETVFGYKLIGTSGLSRLPGYPEYNQNR